MTEERNDKELDEWLVVGTWPDSEAELREIPRVEEVTVPIPPREPVVSCGRWAGRLARKLCRAVTGINTVFDPGDVTPADDTTGVEEAVVVAVDTGCEANGDSKAVCKEGAVPAFISST